MPGYVCVHVCVHRSNTIQTGQKSSLFSFSSCAPLALLTAIVSPHPPLLPFLLNKGTGKFYLHFLKNVITIIIMMTVLMTITVLVKIKGGVSEMVSSSWGEETSAL